jgi:capsular polysaccharide biosynthesis protein
MNDRLYYSREAQAQVQQRQVILVLFVSILSLLMGAVVTMFLTPRSGIAVRRSLNEKFNDVRRDIESRVQDARS